MTHRLEQNMHKVLKLTNWNQRIVDSQVLDELHLSDTRVSVDGIIYPPIPNHSGYKVPLTPCDSSVQFCH